MIVCSVGAGPPGSRTGLSPPGCHQVGPLPLGGRGPEEAVLSEEFDPPMGGGGTGRPKGLLEEMEELMAALNADLSALDADLQSTGGVRSAPPAAEGGTV